MDFLYINKDIAMRKLHECTKRELEELFIALGKMLPSKTLDKHPILKELTSTKSRIYNLKKNLLITPLVELFNDKDFVLTLYKTLTKTSASTYLYSLLLWEKNFIYSDDVKNKFKEVGQEINKQNYQHKPIPLENELSLIKRNIEYSYCTTKDYLFIPSSLKGLLKFCYPIPKDYNIHALKNVPHTQFHYNNEDTILGFIEVVSEMIENNLITFGKSNEKPLAKSLKLIKEIEIIEEFYQVKQLDTLATDMLTRSLYYYKEQFEFQKNELDSLKNLIHYQFKDNLYFSITRLFASHLKKIRFGRYQNQQKEIFDLLVNLIKTLPKESWVSVENIFKHTYYRDLYFEFEGTYETGHYEFVSNDFVEDYFGEKEPAVLTIGDHHAELFHEPILKGAFFYLGALGLLELKYDKPITPYPHIKAKDKEYISVWDGLRYIKLTKLGEYIFNLSSSYTPKEIVLKKDTSIKFDEFKPIITVAKSNTLMIAKLEPFVEKLDNERYILSHAKLFKECKSVKMLKEKIEKFYKNIEKKPPQVFVDFFEESINNANPMKRNLKQIVIELKENKKLLNLLMSHKKLQELFVKAEGYRILVFKDDIPKLSKILKENGFFLEF